MPVVIRQAEKPRDKVVRECNAVRADRCLVPAKPTPMKNDRLDFHRFPAGLGMEFRAIRGDLRKGRPVNYRERTVVNLAAKRTCRGYRYPWEEREPARTRNHPMLQIGLQKSKMGRTTQTASAPMARIHLVANHVLPEYRCWNRYRLRVPRGDRGRRRIEVETVRGTVEDREAPRSSGRPLGMQILAGAVRVLQQDKPSSPRCPR